MVERLLTKEVASGIYHMGDDEALSTNELIALMCRALDRKPHIWKIKQRTDGVLCPFWDSAPFAF